jgi:hypothetical protein
MGFSPGTGGSSSISGSSDVIINSAANNDVLKYSSTDQKWKNGVIPATNITTSSTSTAVSIISSTGTDGTIASATSTTAGALSASDKSKLDGIATGAQTNAVTSVAGRTGAVTLTKSDVSLGSVDNTSDASKPVSSATQTALNARGAVVYHGATASTTRPSGAGSVVWIGTVQPTNWTTNDAWIQPN